MTSPTSSPYTAILSEPSAEAAVKLAFLDELEKIGTATKQNGALKKWVKTTLAISAGTAAGTGTLMVGERVLGKYLKKHWNKLSPQSRLMLLGAGSSAAALGAGVLAKKMLDRKRREES
jgi:hypothetical protein